MVVVLTSILAIYVWQTNVAVLRALRLLQVVKFTRRFPRLRIIIEALMQGTYPLVYVWFMALYKFQIRAPFIKFKYIVIM